jgi:hypothetical protein
MPSKTLLGVVSFVGLVKVPFTSSSVLHVITDTVNDSGKSPSLPRDPGLPAK